MITISTSNIGIGLMDTGSNSVKSTSSKEKKEGVDTFAELMNLSSTQSTDDPSYTDTVDKKTEDSVSVSQKTTEYEKNETVNKTEQSENRPDESAEDTVAKQDTTVKNVATAEEAEVIPEDILAKVIQELQNILTKTLGITEEELATELQTQGIELVDLLDAGNLEQFVLKMQGATKVNMLIDEGLNTQIEGVLKDLQALVSKYNITPEQINATIESFDDVYNSTEPNREITNLQKTEETLDVEVTKNSQAADITNESKVTVATDKKDTSDDSRGNEAKQNTNTVTANLNQAIDDAFSNMEVSTDMSDMELYEADIVRQIIDNVKANVTKTTTSLTVSLNPENLGKVMINVSSEEGVLQAKIIAETEAAKNAIETGLALLKEAFNNQELKIEAIEVMVGTFEMFSEGMDDGSEEDTTDSSGKANTVLGSGGVLEEEIDVQDALQTEIMRMSGNRVNYSI